MYIACPKCHTKFVILNEQIGISGRRVKCSKCYYIWHHKLDYSTVKLSDFNKTPKEFTSTITSLKNKDSNIVKINVPALLPNTQFIKKNNLKILWMIFIFLSLILLCESNHKALYKYDSLRIENINIKNSNDKQEEISYTIINPLDYKVNVPTVRIRIFDTKGKVLGLYKISESNIYLDGKQKINMLVKLKKFLPKAKYLDITIGDNLGFYFN